MMSASSVRNSDLVLAQGRTYSLLSEIFLKGLNAGNLKTIQSIEVFAESLPAVIDLEDAAAEHFDLFHMQIPPYENLFLQSSGMVGDLCGDQVREATHEFEISGTGTDHNLDHSPDHIGEELRLLGKLCLAEYSAIRQGLDDVVQQRRRQQLNFLESHLLRWLHPFIQAVLLEGSPFSSFCCELMLDLVESHVESMEQPERTDEKSGIRSNDPAEMLECRDIARCLTLPVQCGFFLSRRRITAMARNAGLSHGFGSRELMIDNLFESARHFDQMERLVEAFGGLFDESEVLYLNSAKRWPGIQKYANNWAALAVKSKQFFLAAIKLPSTC